MERLQVLDQLAPPSSLVDLELRRGESHRCLLTYRVSSVGSVRWSMSPQRNSEAIAACHTCEQSDHRPLI